MTDLRPPLDVVVGPFGAYGAAPGQRPTVTVPGGSPVEADIVRLPRAPAEVALGGDGSIRVVERQDVFSVRLDQVPQVPRGTVIVAEGKTWLVERVNPVDDQMIDVIVVESV